MTRLKWAAVCCMVLAGGSAWAETGRPRNILEWLFGQNKPPEAPTSITPPAAASPVQTPRRATEIIRPGKADKKVSIRKARPGGPAMPIDPDTRSAAASGVYMGPFRGAGSNAYCVRSCDGFFFPVNFEGAQGQDRYESACQTSCPGSETQVFFMKRGGDIRYSSTARGTPYAALEHAFRYRKERDPACTCKSQDQRWASVLAPVEATMRPGKADITVTEETSQRIAQGEDPAAIARENLKRAEAEKTGDSRQADAAAPKKSPEVRAAFGARIAPADRFIRIDPEPTGALTPDAETVKTSAGTGKSAAAKPAGTPPAPLPPARPTPGPAGDKQVSLPLDQMFSPARQDGAPASPLTRPKSGRPANPFATKTAEASPDPGIDRRALRQALGRLAAADQR